VYISNECNLGCSYCSVLFDTSRHGIPLAPTYSFEELESFITKTQHQLNDSVADIYFFGGEPTMRYDLIEQLINTMNKPHDYIVNYIMHTNGLRIPLAPTNIIEKLKLTLLSINYEEIYNSNHIITPYFTLMVKAINHLKRNPNNILIGRFTVSEKTSLYSACCLFVNYFDYIYWQMDNCDQFNNEKQYIHQYKSDILRLFQYWLSFFRVGIFLNFVPFVTAIYRTLYETNSPSEFYCGYGKSMIYIQTDGKCFACCDNVESKNHFIGNIFEGIEFPNIDLQKTQCKGCKYIRICGGRCGRMHKDFSLKHIDEYCQMNQYMFDLIESNLPEIKLLIKKYPEYKQKLNNPTFAYTEYTA